MKRINLILLLLLCNLLIYASSLDKLRLTNLLKQTVFYITADNHEKAAELRDQALVLFKRIGADNEISTIIELHKISHAYSEKGMYKDAIKTESLLVEVFPLVQPNNKKDYSLYLNDLALYSMEGRDYEKSLMCVNKAIEILKDEDDLATLAAVYIRKAEVLYKSDSTKIDVAIEFQTKALDIYKRLYGETSDKTLSEVQYLANYYEKAGLVKEAYSLSKDIWDVKSKNKKDTPENMPYYRNYIRLADLCKDTLILLNNVCQLDSLAKIVYGEFSDDYIAILATNADYLQHIGLHLQSGNNVTRMLIIADSIHRKELYPYYRYAYDFAKELQLLHQHKPSATIFKRIIEILNKNRINDIKGMLYVKIAYAHSLSRLGEISTALLIINEIETDVLNKYGNTSCMYAHLLADKASCLSVLNEWENAIKYGELASMIEKENGHIEHYASNLSWLAEYYYYSNQIEKALQCDLAELSIEKDLLGEESSRVITIYNNIISLHLNDSLCEKYNIDFDHIYSCVNKFYKNNPGDEISSPHIWLNNIAWAYSRSGDKESEGYSYSVFMMSLELAKNRYGIESEEYMKVLENYSLECLIHEFPNKYRYIYELIKQKKQKLLRIIPYVDSFKRESLWLNEAFWFQNYVSFCLATIPSDTISAIAYDANLFSKGLLLGTQIEIGRLINEEGDSKIQLAYDKLVNKKKRLEDFELSSLPKQIRDSLEIEINNDELKMLRMSKQYSSYMNGFKTTWQDVRNKLKPKDVAIEFEALYHSKDSTEYVALVLKHDYECPKMVRLFMDDGSNYSEKSKIIWNSLDSVIHDCKNIYFAAVSKLHTTPIEYFDYNGAAINTTFNIYRLTSTRQIVFGNESRTLKEAAIYGGLEYDTEIDYLEKDSKHYSNNTRSFAQEVISIDSLGLRAGWDFLPGTLVEAENVNGLLQESSLTTLLYTQNTGTEASFKNLNGKRNSILHVATHGFYYTNEDSIKIQRSGVGNVLLNVEKTKQSTEDASLMRSGLLFAGCNNILKGMNPPNGVDDGILLAKEIANLDLRGLELVTLSACETALGDVTGEGVFGLQRGFKKAGANTILMSLDKVDDEATRILMVEFYKNLMVGKSKLQSLKDAQHHLRQVENGRYDDPKYWASFIMLDGLN